MFDVDSYVQRGLALLSVLCVIAVAVYFYRRQNSMIKQRRALEKANWKEISETYSGYRRPQISTQLYEAYRPLSFNSLLL